MHTWVIYVLCNMHTFKYSIYVNSIHGKRNLLYETNNQDGRPIYREYSYGICTNSKEEWYAGRPGSKNNV